MAEASIPDLIARIQAEGKLTRNSGTNSIKSVKEAVVPVLKAIETSLSATNIELQTIGRLLAKANDLSAEQLEDMRRGNDLQVKDTSAPKKDEDKPSVAPQSPAGGGDSLAVFGGLGGLSTAIAGTLGATLGILSGQFKAIKAFGKMFTPESLSKNLRGLRVGIAMQLELFKAAVNERITAVRTAVTSGMERVKSFLSIGEESKLGKAIASFKSFFAPITELFTSAAEAIKGLAPAEGGPLSRIKNIAARIGGYFKSLGTVIGKVAGLVGKLFAPIAVVITLFDTVKGAIDGYAEGGILGGLEGAITGFFNSLITKPLDLVKDAVAWVVSKLGFTDTAESIKSFSFTKLFNDIVGSIFDGVKGAINVIKDLFTFGEEDKTLLGALGKLTDLVYAPVNMAINFVKGLFGFSSEEDEPFKLQDFIADTVGVAVKYVQDKFSGVVDTVRTKFAEFGDWISGIPDRIMIAGKEMYINLKAKLERGFLMFGDWFASIPDRIKIAGLEVIRSLPGGGLIVDDDDIASARQAMSSRSGDLDAKIKAIESRRLEQLAELDNQARQAAANVIAPTTVNSGGNTTSTVANYYTTTVPTSSLDGALPR